MSSNKISSRLIFFSLLLLLMFGSADPTCLKKCGKIDIPYPFGIGEGCYLEKWYEVICVNSSVPFLSVINKEVVDLSSSGYIIVKNGITSKGCSSTGEEKHLGSLLNLTGTPFYIGGRNRLVVVGCNSTASLTNGETNMVGCTTSCGTKYSTPNKGYDVEVLSCNQNYGYENERTDKYCNETYVKNNDKLRNNIGYCEAFVPDALQQTVGIMIDNTTTTGGCKVAFLADWRWTLRLYSPEYNSSKYPTEYSPEYSSEYNSQLLHAKQYVTVELEWFIDTTNLSFIHSLGCSTMKQYYHNRNDNVHHRKCFCDYNANVSYARCICNENEGYSGYPYIVGGCQVNECSESMIVSCGEKFGICVNTLGSYHCEYPLPPHKNHRPLVVGIGASFGSLILVGGVYLLYKFIRRKLRLNRKKKFFKRNGGLLLQQQLTSTEGSVEKTKVFSSKVLEKATENFSVNRILGEGGQGTVYKGMLVDGSIVAVKKSKVVDEDKLEEFINEVVILSQINHRNIVKILGCCLETNVPVLVYEFVPNGNLFEHLHDEFEDNTMVTWEVRLRIAVDVAGALSYLHSSASSPIYHRDVKSTNIMLDEKYRAKVSDFGTSRSVTVDHTHLTTVVSGTAGYVDPEYFQSSQFTDKSDVYSFGVVLVELITGEKSISYLRSQENRTLATYFILAMKENRLIEIIDARIKDGCVMNQVNAMGKLARKCLNLKGRKRPSMREVSMELDKIRSSRGDMQPHDHVNEDEEEEEKEEVVEANKRLELWNTAVATAPANIKLELWNNNAVATTAPDLGDAPWSDVEPLFPLRTK